MFCSAAMKSSMNVPDVVKMAIMMKALIATEGPASHSHHDIPRNALPASAEGAVVHAEHAEDDVEHAARVGEPVGPVDAHPRQDLVDRLRWR